MNFCEHHNSVTINLSLLRQEESACQLLTGSLEFFCTHDRETRSMAGKEKMKRSIQRGGGGVVVNMGVIEGHGERDGGRRAAAFWLLSKGSVSPCEQTKILVS